MQLIKRSAKLLFLVLPCLIGVMISKPANATPPPDFTFTLSNPNIIAPAGANVTFDGTVTFTGTPTSEAFTADAFGPPADLDTFTADSSFINFLFTSPTAGSTYTGAIFDASLDPAANVGDTPIGPGSFLEVGDNTGSISLPFSLTVGPAVTAAPEPSSMAAFGLGAFVLLGFGIRTRKMSAARI